MLGRGTGQGIMEVIIHFGYGRDKKKEEGKVRISRVWTNEREKNTGKYTSGSVGRKGKDSEVCILLGEPTTGKPEQNRNHGHTRFFWGGLIL